MIIDFFKKSDYDRWIFNGMFEIISDYVDKIYVVEILPWNPTAFPTTRFRASLRLD